MQTNQTTQTQEPTCLITVGTENKLTFDAVLTQTIDEAFSTLNCQKEIYLQLETKYKITPQIVTQNIDAFTDALKDMFGEASLLIELKIISQLHSKAPDFKYYVGKDQELTLSGYLSGLKNFLA
jgi:hypothetical protein